MSNKHFTLAAFLKKVSMTKTALAEQAGVSRSTLAKADKDGVNDTLALKLALVAVRVIGPEETAKFTGLEVKRRGRPGRPGVPINKDALETLKKVREHYSLASVGAILECSPTKVYRMEHQKMGVNPTEFKKLQKTAAKL
jgi:DNA-binding XRE family transcriptional regulator